MTEAERPGPALRITPSQTVGPFFAYALTPSGRYALTDLATGDLTSNDAVGARIRVEGRVLDGDGMAVADAMIELWQADGGGRYPGRDPALSNSRFTGFGRAATDQDGRFEFKTVKPGRVPGPGGLQAPHINLGVFARGVLRRMFTRVYFEDEAAANGSDPILALVPEEARHTLLARRHGADGLYSFDIRLQGVDETIFFEA